MPSSAEPAQPKILRGERAVLAACALFELSTKEDELREMAAHASLPCGDEFPERAAALRREWFGFVHAGIICALMDKAPAETVEAYIACTRDLLARLGGYGAKEAENFIDTTLQAYASRIVKNEQRACPQLLLENTLGRDEAAKLSPDQLAFMAGMMAITLCNILDTLDRYCFLPDAHNAPAEAGTKA